MERPRARPITSDSVQRALGAVLVAFGLDLPETATNALADHLESVTLRGGETLFRQGDASDAFYVVVSGRLRVLYERAGQPSQILNEIGRAESVGELSLITGQRRTATVVAIRDSELARLSRSSFADLQEHHPAAVMSIARELLTRLSRPDRPGARSTAPSTFALVPASVQVPLGEFGRQLASALDRVTGDEEGTLLVTSAMVDQALGDGASQRAPDDPGHGEVIAWLNRQHARYMQLIYLADPLRTNWTERCVRQADWVLCVADADGAPREPEVPIVLGDAGAPPRELVLLHRDRAVRPRGTAGWLERLGVRSHHHVCAGVPSDFDRLARRLLGEAVALVLGGGGARGFVHVGVVRALREAGVPIGMVGGTSMGALIAAEVALEHDDATMATRLRRFLVERGPPRNYTLPLVALTTGAGLGRALRAACGDVAIEDLWVPFFAVSADLTTSQVVVHDRGPLWRALRGSNSLPGVTPPLIDRRHLLVDGGVLNNLPADVVPGLYRRARIIAVDPNPARGPEAEADDLDALTARQVLWQRFTPFGRRVHYPGIGEILARVTLLGSVHQAARVAESVDLYLHPSTDGIRAHEYSAFDRAVEIGYRATIEALEKNPTFAAIR